MKTETEVRKEWNDIGSKYAKEVNEMVAFGEKNGWDNWEGKEPEDNRDHLADVIYTLLKKANETNTVDDFRKKYPPANIPMSKFIEQKGQSIAQLQFINHQQIVFLTGTSYDKRQAYFLDKDTITKLDSSVQAIGKSIQNGVFAVLKNNTITTMHGWEGETIRQFTLDKAKDLGITELIPFNDGLQVLLISSKGIYLLTDTSEKMIHPLPDKEYEDWTSDIDMENATLSNDNQYIVVADQGSEHRVLSSDGTQICEVDLASSYPHFCLFSKDDKQLITNSYHFYNGVTLGVLTDNFTKSDITPSNSEIPYNVIDEEMRVYCGVATTNYYILGDAHGYIRAIDHSGKCIWRLFLGSTISGMAVSDDDQTLWVGSHSGIIHKLILDKGLRDDHTIGNCNHYEEFRMLIWKDEPIMKW